MKKLILFILLLAAMLYYDAALAQAFSFRSKKPKKLVTIPVVPDSSSTNSFCVCKVVTYKSSNLEVRTDAIFAGSSPERNLHVKDLIRNIEFELQQALVFFDSYKLEGQYSSPVDCNTMSRYMKAQQERINKYVVLSPSYASRF